MTEDFSVAVEAFDFDKSVIAGALAPRIQRMQHVGVCVEDYDVIEAVLPGALKQVDRRKLTTYPSKTQQTVAVESVLEAVGKIAGAAVIGAGVGYAVGKLIDWIVGKLSGGGSGGDSKVGGGNLGKEYQSAVNDHFKLMNDYHAKLSKAVADSGEKMRNATLNPRTDDKDLNKAVVEYLFNETDVNKIALMQVLVRKNEKISTKNFKKEFETIVNGPIYRKSPHMAGALASNRPVSGAVMIGTVYGDRLPGILRDVSSVFDGLTDCLKQASDVLNASNGQQAGLRVGELGHKVVDLRKRVERIQGLRGSKEFEKAKELSRRKFSYRPGDGVEMPDTKLADVDLEGPGKLDIDNTTIVSKLRSVRRRKDAKSEFWNKQEFKHQEQSFKEHMKSLTEISNQILPVVLMAGRYSDACRQLMSSISKTRILGIITNL
jgi:hypothetical protein